MLPLLCTALHGNADGITLEFFILVYQVSNRDEPFMDLSLDVEQNSSVTACLRSFSSTETLTRKNKFFCESCNALQVRAQSIYTKVYTPLVVLRQPAYSVACGDGLQGLLDVSFPLDYMGSSGHHKT